MTPNPNPSPELRDRLSHHEQMLDAQAGCVPCKLCGGKAIITDAGTGAGYYVACGNSVSFRDSKGCLINDRRLGGWAYNVMDWWNRLHSTAALTPPNPAETVTVALPGAGEIREALKILRSMTAHATEDADEIGQSITATKAAAALEAYWARVGQLWRESAFPTGPEHAGLLADEMDKLLSSTPALATVAAANDEGVAEAFARGVEAAAAWHDGESAKASETERSAQLLGFRERMLHHQKMAAFHSTSAAAIRLLSQGGGGK